MKDKNNIPIPRVLGVTITCLLITGSVENKFVVAFFLLLIAAWLTFEVYCYKKKR